MAHVALEFTYTLHIVQC